MEEVLNRKKQKEMKTRDFSRRNFRQTLFAPPPKKMKESSNCIVESFEISSKEQFKQHNIRLPATSVTSVRSMRHLPKSECNLCG